MAAAPVTLLGMGSCVYACVGGCVWVCEICRATAAPPPLHRTHHRHISTHGGHISAPSSANPHSAAHTSGQGSYYARRFSPPPTVGEGGGNRHISRQSTLCRDCDALSPARPTLLSRERERERERDWRVSSWLGPILSHTHRVWVLWYIVTQRHMVLLWQQHPPPPSPPVWWEKCGSELTWEWDVGRSSLLNFIISLGCIV